jgi:muramoyltetrapeptide carboxypeptidase
MVLPVKEKKTLIKPPALKNGDRVGLVAPCSRPATPAVVAAAERVVREMGLVPVTGKNVLNVHGFMAGTDSERLSDLRHFLHDPSIAGIFCITGGYGAIHLLPFLDYKGMADNPKVIVGGEENSVLLNAIFERAGLVTFYGPNLEDVKTSQTFSNLQQSVTTHETFAPVTAFVDGSDSRFEASFYCAVEGDVEGHLIGGNLTSLVSLLGTPFEPRMSGSILFLDDVHEQTGILDRWFTTLYLAGHLQTCKGVALSLFENCGPKDSINMLSVMDMFSDRLKYLDKPSCFGLPFGQTRNTQVVPLGINGRLFAAAGRLEFAEPALS